MSDLYIIAAGNGSRMKANTPKALVTIVDEPCLTTTLQQIGSKFYNVFIVTNVHIQDQWEEYFSKTRARYPLLLQNVHNVPIASGLGDGHAVLCGFDASSDETLYPSEDVVVAWGDVFFQDAAIIDELLAEFLHPTTHVGIIPAVLEDRPYVTLQVDSDMTCLSADFSKYGEIHLRGYHDQSVFRFQKSKVRESLHELHRALWKNGKYITPGGELSLLHTFHHLYNKGRGVRVYPTNHPTLSFNTPEEVAAIQSEISKKWRSQHSLP